MKNSSKRKKGMILASCVFAMAAVMILCTVMISLASGAALGWRAEKKRFDVMVKLDSIGEDFLRGADVEAEGYQCDFDVTVSEDTLIIKSGGRTLLTVVVDEDGNIRKWIYGE